MSIMNKLKIIKRIMYSSVGILVKINILVIALS